MITSFARRPRLILAALAACFAGGAAEAAEPVKADATAAVAIMYHRFGETGIPSTNIRVEQLDRHLQMLKEGGFTVLPLSGIVDLLMAGKPVPPKTVAITVDDAYASAMTVGWPRIKAAGYPLTIFIATEPVDRGTRGYLTWDQIRQLVDEGVTIGAHSESHAHMAKLGPEQAAAEIERSNARFKAELGFVPKLFAYPYGEADAATIQAASNAYDAAFGQHSGVITASDNRYFLPRFALNEHYGDDDRFRLLINALPIPVEDLAPADPTLKANPPAFGFTIADANVPMNGLRCFSSADGETKTEILGRRVEVRMEKPFAATRGRINCTAPGPDGRWRWYGRLFYLPEGVRLPGVKDD
jgi:peptidoglycan/xylan/chitin deacetylase (PgdA/CDA1 family)